MCSGSMLTAPSATGKVSGPTRVGGPATRAHAILQAAKRGCGRLAGDVSVVGVSEPAPRVRPIALDALVEELAERIHATAAGAGRLRVAVDGADAARPGMLADALVAPLRLRGHAVVRVRAEDHLRPASLRFERGRDDPDSFYDDWLDGEGLCREVLEPLAPGGSGLVRPRRWDAAADRAHRDAGVPVPRGGVLVLSGPLLLGRGLPLDWVVHLDVSAAALARRTPDDLRWTLPAYRRYAEEVGPATVADLVVRVDDPRHPAVVDKGSRRS
jgi:hypothetical protein